MNFMRPTKLSNDKPSLVDTTLFTKENRTFISITNLLGDHRSDRIKTFDYIPPIDDINVSLLIAKKVTKVYSLMNKVELEFDYKGNKLTFKYPHLLINDIIEII